MRGAQERRRDWHSVVLARLRRGKAYPGIARTLKALPIVATLWHSMGAHSAGDDSDVPLFALSGFGTVGVVHSSESHADFATSLLRPNGAGFSHEWSDDVDSKVGGQIIASFAKDFTAVVQVISEQRFDNTYTPYLEWANIKYQVTPDLSVRLGRTVSPNFLVTEQRKVGYANPWLRPPLEIYNLVPISGNDGVDATYKLHIGAVTQSLLATYGRTSATQPDGSTDKATRSWVIADTVEYGAMTAHLTYQQADITVSDLHSLLSAFRQFGIQGNAIAEKYDEYNRQGRIISAGAIYDPEKWFVMAEWGIVELHSVLGVRSGWYATGGYRVARFTPYLTYGRLKGDSSTSDPGLNVSELPVFLAGSAEGLNAALNGILGSVPVQRTIALGVRWDLHQNLDLKLQYDHTVHAPGSPGTLINLQPDFTPGGTVNLVSVAFDFVL
jgi:hypothetical protein